MSVISTSVPGLIFIYDSTRLIQEESSHDKLLSLELEVVSGEPE